LIALGGQKNLLKSKQEKTRNENVYSVPNNFFWVIIRLLTFASPKVEANNGIRRKIEKQAYQLSEGIVVNQLKTVLNDKFRAFC
jgi:hypothetical protein